MAVIDPPQHTFPVKTTINLCLDPVAVVCTHWEGSSGLCGGVMVMASMVHHNDSVLSDRLLEPDGRLGILFLLNPDGFLAALLGAPACTGIL